LQRLAPEEVEAVTREIATLHDVSPEVVNAVLNEFAAAVRGAGDTARGGVTAARALLEETLGAPRARQVLEGLQRRPGEALKRLTRSEPSQLAERLRSEHPQTIALVLAHMDPAGAGPVVRALPQDVAVEVLYRLARLEQVAPETLAVVEGALSESSVVALVQNRAVVGGPAVAASLLNEAGAAGKELLAGLQARDGDMGAQIAALMFTFEDLVRLDTKGMQRVVRDIETKELALALKAASDDVKRHIKSAMSERAGAALDEAIEFLGPVRVKDVQAAHARILENVLRLEEAGELTIQRSGGGGEDDVIA
jgi:flagellar motor switch protein FliG